MKLVNLITWIAAHWDLVMMLLGELLVACIALFAAVKSVALTFIKLADLTATRVDNNVFLWISTASDAAGALCDRILRKIPLPRSGPSPLTQPISTRETRALARQTLFGAAPSIPPMGSGRPPAGIAHIITVESNPVPPDFHPVDSDTLDRPTTPNATTDSLPETPKAPAS